MGPVTIHHILSPYMYIRGAQDCILVVRFRAGHSFRIGKYDYITVNETMAIHSYVGTALAQVNDGN